MKVIDDSKGEIHIILYVCLKFRTDLVPTYLAFTEKCVGRPRKRSGTSGT